MNLPDFNQMTRREIEDYLIEKSLVEPEFREKMIANPQQTLSALGLPVGNVKINVFVEQPGSFSIVLPHVLRDADEVSPEELDQMAGGYSSPRSFFRGYL